MHIQEFKNKLKQAAVMMLFAVSGCGISSSDSHLNPESMDFKIPVTPELAFLGGDSSGGGQGIACRSPDGQVTVELVDLYEARTPRGIQLDLGEASLSVQEKWRLAVNRIERFDRLKAEAYRDMATRFMDETVFLDNTVLAITQDSLLSHILTGCWLVQLAIQREPEFPEDKRFLVAGDFWNLMDNDNRAALILHEIIYREARVRGQTNSKKSRYFNSYITSGNLNDASNADYDRLTAITGLSSFSFKHAFFMDQKLNFRDAVHACEAKGWFLSMEWDTMPLTEEENRFAGFFKKIWGDDKTIWTDFRRLDSASGTAEITILNQFPPQPHYSPRGVASQDELHYFICIDYLSV